MRAIGRARSHSSSASTGHSTSRTPSGNRSGARPSIGEYARRSRGCIGELSGFDSSMHLAVLIGPIRLAQLAFENFPGRIARQRVDEIDRAGHLETADAGARELDQLFDRDLDDRKSVGEGKRV